MKYKELRKLFHVSMLSIGVDTENDYSDEEGFDDPETHLYFEAWISGYMIGNSATDDFIKNEIINYNNCQNEDM